jgi:hypothetical protein
MLRAGAIILTFWAGVSSLFFSANPRSFRIHFLQQSKGAFLSHPRFKREVEAFTGRAPLFRPSQALGLLRSVSDFGRVGLKSYCLFCHEG